MLVYNAIIILSIIATALRSQWAVAGGARCAEKMFLLMTDRVLRAPLSYFETTPLGRILNRFTYDVEVLDIELSVSMAGIMIAASWFVASIIVMVRKIVCSCIVVVDHLHTIIDLLLLPISLFRRQLSSPGSLSD